MNSPIDARFLSLLTEVLIKSLMIFGIAFGTARLLRRASALAQQSVWQATILGLLALPLLCIIVPAWQISLPAVAPVLAPLPPPALAETLPLTPPLKTAAPTVAPPAPKSATSEMPPLPAEEEILPPPVLVAPQPPLPTYPFVFALYLCGVCVVLLRLPAAFVRLHFLARRAEPCGSLHLQYAAQEAARKLGLKRPVRLLLAPSGSQERIPMTWGFLRPCVLLPADAQEWGSSRLDAVLLHEFAHIARADWLMQQIAALTCALYWFHPLVWKAAGLLKLESERACDESVIAAGIAPAEYAAVLLATARAHRRRVFSHEGTISMASTTHLSVRIQSLLDNSASRRKLSRRLVFGFGIFSLAGLLALAALRPADAAEPPAQAEIVAPEEPVDALPPIAPTTASPPAEALPVVPPSHAYAQKIDSKAAALMKQVESKANSIRSLTADVEMTILNSRPKQTISFGNGRAQQHGTLRLMKPSLYRLRFQEEQDNFVDSDGTTEWIAQTDTVYQRYPLKKADSGHLPFPLGNFIAPCMDGAPYVGGLGNSRTVYKGQQTEQGNVFDIVEVQRDKPGKGYTYRLYIGTDKIIHRATLLWKEGHKYQQDVRLSNIQVDPTLSTVEFAFTPEETARYSAPRKYVPKLISAPPVKPAEDFKGKISWGEVKDGFQTGLRLPIDKPTYTKSDQLPVQFVLRNVGKTTRRVKLVVPSSVYLYGVSEKHFSSGLEGDFRWRGRDDETPHAKLMRTEITLVPDKIVALPLSIEPANLNRWSGNSPLSGSYTTHWEPRIEYRDADKPNSQRRKMPLPGSLSVNIIAVPDNKTEMVNPPVVRVAYDTTQTNTLYGETVKGIQLGAKLPMPLWKIYRTEGVPNYSLDSNWNGDRFIITKDQAFHVDLYLKNTTNKAVTLSTYTPAETVKRSDGDRTSTTQITLHPLENKYLYSTEIEFREGQREFRLTDVGDTANLAMIVTKNKQEYTLSVLKRIWFDQGGEAESISSGRLKLLNSSKTAMRVPLGEADARQQSRNHELIAALKQYNEAAVLSALKAKANPNARDNSLSSQAGQDKHSASRGKKSALGDPALSLALQSYVYNEKGHPYSMQYPLNTAIVRALLEAGANPLIYAADRQSIEIVKMLLERKVNVNARGYSGWTALSCAVRHAATKDDHVSPVVELLLSHGADVNQADDQGITPLMEAALTKHYPEARLLMAKGAKVSARDKQGHNALHYASVYRGGRVIFDPKLDDLLLEAGSKQPKR